MWRVWYFIIRSKDSKNSRDPNEIRKRQLRDCVSEFWLQLIFRFWLAYLRSCENSLILDLGNSTEKHESCEKGKKHLIRSFKSWNRMYQICRSLFCLSLETLVFLETNSIFCSVVSRCCSRNNFFSRATCKTLHALRQFPLKLLRKFEKKQQVRVHLGKYTWILKICSITMD